MNGVWLFAETNGEALDLTYTSTMILLAIGMVILNGFFVAAEFALVKVRVSQINAMVSEGMPFAKTAKWLMRSLGPFVIGVSAGDHDGLPGTGLCWRAGVRPSRGAIVSLGWRQSETLFHIFAFIIAFSIITAFHLVIGEQAPKIFAIRRAGVVGTLVCVANEVVSITSCIRSCMCLTWPLRSFWVGWE